MLIIPCFLQWQHSPFFISFVHCSSKHTQEWHVKFRCVLDVAQAYGNFLRHPQWESRTTQLQFLKLGFMNQNRVLNSQEGSPFRQVPHLWDRMASKQAKIHTVPCIKKKKKDYYVQNVFVPQHIWASLLDVNFSELFFSSLVLFESALETALSVPSHSVSRSVWCRRCCSPE